VTYLLKTARGADARAIDDAAGKAILDRGRHEGRRVVEVFVRHADGHIDRYEERTRRKLGSNAISSRTWLCQTYTPNGAETWSDDRYIPNPEVEIQEIDPEPDAVLLVMLGAEGDTDANVAQLAGLQAAR
jgi:hypothetical protein